MALASYPKAHFGHYEPKLDKDNNLSTLVTGVIFLVPPQWTATFRVLEDGSPVLLRVPDLHNHPSLPTDSSMY